MYFTWTVEGYHLMSWWRTNNSKRNQYSLMHLFTLLCVKQSSWTSSNCGSNAWWMMHACIVLVTALDIQVSLRNQMANFFCPPAWLLVGNPLYMQACMRNMCYRIWDWRSWQALYSLVLILYWNAQTQILLSSKSILTLILKVCKFKSIKWLSKQYFCASKSWSWLLWSQTQHWNASPCWNY